MLDAPARRRAISLSLLRLDELTETFQKQAKGGDIEAGNLMVRLEAERRALLGLSGSGYDPVQLIQSSKPESSLAAIEEALAHVAGRSEAN